MNGAADDPHQRRHSVAEEPSLISDPVARAEAEARNGLKQFDLGIKAIVDAVAKGKDFRLRPSLILALHREALNGISTRAGNWRPAGVGIEGSHHQPPGGHLVPELIEDLCHYVNEHWLVRSPIHLAAYVMWRLNWIHPFTDGNGRTSRVLSYVVLSIGIGYVLPGLPAIPDQIVENRRPYFEALEQADAAFMQDRVDVSAMEALIERLLAVQLTNVLKTAGSTPYGR
jgi:Fic family protein